MGGKGHIRQGGQSQGLAWEALGVRPQGPRVACKPSWPLQEGTGPDLLCPPPPGPSGNPGSQGEFWGVGGNPPTHCRQPEQFQKALLMGKVRRPRLASDQPCVFPGPEILSALVLMPPLPHWGLCSFPFSLCLGPLYSAFPSSPLTSPFSVPPNSLPLSPTPPACISVSQQPAAQT